MGRTACTEPQCLYKGALYLYFTITPHPLTVNRAAKYEYTHVHKFQEVVL